MVSPSKNQKRILSREEAETRNSKRMKSKAAPAKKLAEQEPEENPPAVASPAFEHNAVADESIFIPCNLMKVTSLDGTNVEVVQDPTPGSNDAGVVSGELEAAHQNVTLYLKPPRPKRGEGAYTTNSLFPPTFPEELRNKIYRYLVVYPHPITISELGPVLQKYYMRHLEDCTNAGQKCFLTRNGEEKYHPRELREGDKTEFVGRRQRFDIADGFCIDPYTKKRTMIEVPDTVLSHRLICKQVNNEITKIFWTENTFAFPDANDMHSKLLGLFNNAQSVQLKYSRLAFNSSHSEQIRNIQYVNLQFSSKKALLYVGCADRLPNVAVLRLSLSHDSNLLTFDRAAPKGQGKNPLSLAIGIDMFAMAFSKINGPCKQIRSVEIFGTDLVKKLTVNEDEWYYEKADINHADAIGPIIRKNIFEVKRPWMSAEDLKKQAEKKKERREKERREAQGEEARRLADEKLKKDIGDKAMAKLLEKRKAAEKLAKEKLDKEKRMVAREKAKKRGCTEVQISQANLQWQVLGRGDERYLGAPSLPNNNFVGPINVPRPSVLYADWRAMNGNTPPTIPPPPNHKDTPALSDTRKFLLDNNYRPRIQPIQPRPTQVASHIQPHEGQAQHNNQSQDGQGHSLQTYKVQSQHLLGQQLPGQYVQAQHYGAHHGQGIGFRTYGQPLDNHGLQLQGYQAQAFLPQPNYSQNSQAQRYQATCGQAASALAADNYNSFEAQNVMNNGNINGNAMMNYSYGQSLSGTPTNTQPGPAIPYGPLSMIGQQNPRPTQVSCGSSNVPANAQPGPGLQYRPHGIMGLPYQSPAQQTQGFYDALENSEPGQANQHHSTGMLVANDSRHGPAVTNHFVAPAYHRLAQLGQDFVTGPIPPRPVPTGQDHSEYPKNAPTSNGLFTYHHFGADPATPRSTPESQSSSRDPSNSPNGYGPFSNRRSGTGPSPGFGTNSNNTGGSQHQG